MPKIVQVDSRDLRRPAVRTGSKTARPSGVCCRVGTLRGDVKARIEQWLIQGETVNRVHKRLLPEAYAHWQEPGQASHVVRLLGEDGGWVRLYQTAVYSHQGHRVQWDAQAPPPLEEQDAELVSRVLGEVREELEVEADPMVKLLLLSAYDQAKRLSEAKASVVNVIEALKAVDSIRGNKTKQQKFWAFMETHFEQVERKPAGELEPRGADDVIEGEVVEQLASPGGAAT